MWVYLAWAGSPYPRKMSCSQSGMTVSSFIKSRMLSSTALKLFSYVRQDGDCIAVASFNATDLIAMVYSEGSSAVVQPEYGLSWQIRCNDCNKA